MRCCLVGAQTEVPKAKPKAVPKRAPLVKVVRKLTESGPARPVKKQKPEVSAAGATGTDGGVTVAQLVGSDGDSGAGLEALIGGYGSDSD